VMPPSCVGRMGGIRHLVLACPRLAALDLRSLRWPHLEELRLDVELLGVLRPPDHDIPLPEPVEGASQTVEVRSRQLLSLDLSGMAMACSVAVHLMAPGARVTWPRRNTGATPVRLVLELPEAKDPLPPPSPLDGAITSVDLRGCHALSAAALAAAVARWPHLDQLDLPAGVHLSLEPRVEQAAGPGAAPHPAMAALACQEAKQPGLAPVSYESIRQDVSLPPELLPTPPQPQPGTTPVRQSSAPEAFAPRQQVPWHSCGLPRSTWAVAGAAVSLALLGPALARLWHIWW